MTFDVTRPWLQAEQLACRRGARVLFKGLNLQVLPGQLWWVRGHNGCGKTSLLRLLAGLAAPAAGQLQRRGHLAWLGHANALKEELSALEALHFLCRLQGDDGAGLAADCAAALARAGLPRSHWSAPVRSLSQGQRRRVALARLFMPASAALWILDEPFDALDTPACDTLAQALQQHTARGGAAVLTSHLEAPLLNLHPHVLQLDQAVGQTLASRAPGLPA